MKQFKTIRSELSRFISIAFIILQIIMSLTIYLILTNTMIAELSKSRIDTLVLVSEKLHMLQTNMRTISNMFYEDHHIYASIMGEPLESSEAFDMEAYITIQSFKHRRAFKELSNKFDVAILSDSGHRYHSNRSMRIDLQGIPDSSPSARPDQLFFVIGDNMSTREDRAKNLYLSVQNYYNVLTEQYVGNLFICVDEREVYNCYAEILNETNSIFFVDPNGLIVSHRDEGLVNTSLQSDTYKDFLISDEPYQIHGNILMSKYYSPDTGLYIVEENMLSNVLEPMQSMILGIIVVVLSISGLAILMSFVISRRITRPLNMFCSNIVEAGRGNMEPTNIESQYLEINQLSYNFNDMKRRVKTLMDNIKRQEKHLRESELKFLRAQINPHFIYNTLFSIRCTIEIGKEKEAADMLSLFMTILKKTLHASNELHTIQEEMEYLAGYIALLRLRYGSNLAFETDIPANLRHHKIIKSVLQPVVENSVFHGIEPAGGNGVIKISVQEKSEKLEISIEDNGVGISAEKQHTILKPQDPTYRRADHIGLSNVLSRIQLNYGDEYGITIHSEPGKGTKVVVCLPLIK